MDEALFWWLRYLSIFALNSPFGMPVKFTVGVTAHDGLQAAKILRKEPYDVVDAYGRCCQQVQTDDKLVAFEWLTPVPETSFGGAPASWGNVAKILPVKKD